MRFSLRIIALACVLLASERVALAEEKDRLRSSYAYKPMYFLYGAEPLHHTKFQFSFKYPVLRKSELPEKWDWLGDIYFAYTQKSFWDLESESSPFYDSNYNPEFFYLKEGIQVGAIGISTMDIQLGFEHESNGQDGLDSRSWNRLYARTVLMFGEPDAYHMLLAPKIWWITEDSDNPDIDDYLGYGELEITVTKPDHMLTRVRLRKGAQGNHGYIELTVAYPAHKLGLSWPNFYLYGQAAWGEGDSLLSYREDLSQYRIGVAVIP